MDPTQRNITSLGSKVSQNSFTTTSQAGSFTYQITPQMAAYPRAPGKLPSVQSFMGGQMGTFVQSYQPVSQDQGTLMGGLQGGYITTASQVNALPSIATFQGQGQVSNVTTGTVNVLPSMGTFVSNLSPAGNNAMTQMYRNVGTWQGQGHQQVQGLMSPNQQGSNALPSFGQFFMPQQFQQGIQNFQATQMGQPMLPSNPQAPENLPNLYHLNQAMVNPGQFNLAQSSAKFNSNFGALLNQTSAIPCQVNRSLQLTNQVPSVNTQNVSQIAPQTYVHQVIASCNQVTNTTPSVVMVTSTGTVAMATAHVHETSMTSTHSDGALKSPKSPRCSSRSSEASGSVVDNEKDRGDTSSTHPESVIRGCDTDEIVVPFGWKRLVIGDCIVYESPSGTQLHSVEEVSRYLSTDGTCKCGLECPVLVNKLFNFNVSIPSRSWSLDIDNAENMTKLCNHKRKIVAMAAFQSSKALSESCQDAASSVAKTKKEAKSRKKKGKVNHQTGPYDGLLVSQLIAQRDRLKNNPLGAEVPMAEEGGMIPLETNSQAVERLSTPGSVESHQSTDTPSVSTCTRQLSVTLADVQDVPSVTQTEMSGADRVSNAEVLGSHGAGCSATNSQTQHTKTHILASQQGFVSDRNVDLAQESQQGEEVMGLKLKQEIKEQCHTALPSCQQVGATSAVMLPTSGKGQRSEVKDPTDDLGPISSGKQIKLDFSKVSTQAGVSGRSSQPLPSPSHPMMSPGAGMMSPTQQMVNKSPSHQMQSPTHMMVNRPPGAHLPSSRPPSQPLVSPTGMNCQTNMQHMVSPNQPQYSPLMIQTSSAQEHFQMQQAHGQMRSSPRFTFPPNQMIQPGNPGMFVQMHSGNLPLEHMNPAMHRGTFNMGMMGVPGSQQQGMMGNTSQHAPGVMQGIPQGNTPMYQYNTPPPGYAGLPVNFMGNPTGQPSMGNPRSPYHIQPGMYHMANPVLSGMFDQNWPEKKKPKPKKPRAKKEKKKPQSNVFESGTPPPNVDVSQLKDQGRGPIPKVKSSTPPSSTQSSTSFLENPTAFLAEQTVLISNSLTSTLSSPPHGSSGMTDLKLNDDSKTGIGSDVESDKKISVQETVETSSSPNVVVHNTSPTGIGPVANVTSSTGSISSLAAAVGAVMSNVAKTAMENSSSASLSGALSSESHLTSNLSDTNIFTEDRCESLSPEDSNEECPALTETITPSSVVHHTPDNNKKEDVAICENEKEVSESVKSQESSSIATSSIASEILSKFGPALLSVPVQEKSGLLASRSPFGSVQQTMISTGLDGKSSFVHRPPGNYNTLQQMLGHTPANQFPASNLLSAAARAQMAQQNQLNQNGTDLFIGQQPLTNFHLNQSLVSKLATTTSLPSQSLTINKRIEADLHTLLKQSVATTSGQDSTKSETTTVKSASSTTQPTHSFNALKKALAATTNSDLTNIGLSLSSVPGLLTTIATTSSSSTSLSHSVATTVSASASVPSLPGMTLSCTTPSVADAIASSNCPNVSTLGMTLSSVTVSSLSSQKTLPNISSSVQNIVSSVPANIVKPLQTTVVPSIASLLPVTTTTQNPAQTLIAGQQAGIQNMTPLSIPNSSISNTVTISQNPIVSLTQIPAVGNPQSTTLSSISNIQQGVTPQGNLQQQGINPQAVMNLFQNIGMQQIQQSQGLNPMQTSNTVANFQPSTLMMPSAIPSNINQDGVSCVQLPQSNFGLSGPLPSLLGQCTPNFSGGNNQLPGFSLENMFQANQPKSGQLMQIVQGESQPGCVQIKNAMATQSCDISQPMNKLFTEQVATSQQGQVLLVPNLQLPMLQILGTNPAVNVSTEKQAFPAQFSQNTDLQGLINQLQSSLSQMGSPLGMVNMQQVVNNLTTGSNLTAMQLQTLQLQQQLLQQIQQLQGMQSLISQINLQNQGASTITTVANRNNIVMTTGDATSSNSAGGADDKSVSMVTMVNDVSTTTESPPHPMFNDDEEDEDLQARDDDQGEVTPGIGEDLIDGLEEGENSMEMNEQNSIDSADLQVLANSEDEGKHFPISTSSENTCDSEVGSSSIDQHYDASEKYLKGEHSIADSESFYSDSQLESSQDSNVFVKQISDRATDNVIISKTKESNVDRLNIGADLVSTSSINTSIESGAIQSTSYDEDESLDVCSTEGMENVMMDYSNILPGNHESSQMVVMDLSMKCQGDTAPSSSFTPSVSRSNVGAAKISEVKVRSEETQEPSVVTRSKRSLRQTANPDSSTVVENVEVPKVPLPELPRALKRPLEVELAMQDDDSVDTAESPCTSVFPVTFTEGDLIWGQIRGFPSWPGKVVPPSEVIDPEPLETGKLWIKWYGDHTFTQVEQEKLKSLAEGLYTHYRAKKKRKGRKMNSNLESAIQEAMKDMDPQKAQELKAVLSSISSGKSKGSKKKKVQ